MIFLFIETVDGKVASSQFQSFDTRIGIQECTTSRNTLSIRVADGRTNLLVWKADRSSTTLLCLTRLAKRRANKSRHLSLTRTIQASGFWCWTEITNVIGRRTATNEEQHRQDISFHVDLFEMGIRCCGHGAMSSTLWDSNPYSSD